MVQQEQEEVKYVNEIRSESVRRTASPPDWTESQHADSDSATFSDYIEGDLDGLEDRGMFSIHPVSNTGATPTTPPPQKTKIDTLSLTLKESIALLKELLYQSLKPEYQKLSIGFSKLKRGANGYTHGIALTVNRREIAKIFYGCAFNQKQDEKPQIYIGGNGDTDYFNFVLLSQFLSQVEDPTITRNDISLDDYHGVITLDDIRQAYIDGKFKSKNSPKNPGWKPIGGENPIDGTHYGITYQIGSRSSMNFLRNYLKGYEVFRKQLDAYEKDQDKSMISLLFFDNDYNKKMITVDGYNDGLPFDIRKWLRMELEMKSKTGRKLPLDSLIYTDEYFAGAYPFLKEVLGSVDGIRPKQLKPQDELELVNRIQNHKSISGAMIEDLIYLGWSNDDIVKILRSGKGPSQKLIRSGLALRTPPGE